MQYRIQFLDRSANVIREWSAGAQSGAGAIELIVDAACWRPTPTVHPIKAPASTPTAAASSAVVSGPDARKSAMFSSAAA